MKGVPLFKLVFGLLLTIYGATPMAEPIENDPCTDDYRHIILDDKTYPGAESKISAMEKIAGRCAKTTGQYEFRLASLYTELGKLDIAESLLTQGMALGSGFEREFRLALADILLVKGDLSRAEEQFAELTHNYPDWFLGYMKLGVLRMEQQRFKDAVVFLEKANALEKNAFTYRCLAIAHNQLGEHDAAVASINVAFEMDESILGDSDAMLSAVYSYGAIGKIEVAKNLLAMTLRAQPAIENDPRYQQALGYLGKRLEEMGASDR